MHGCDLGEELARISSDLTADLAQLSFAEPVTHAYLPTNYAKNLSEAFFAQAQPKPEALLLGMNPGPWGMAQTGVPFGEIAAVRNFLGISGEVTKPNPEHPKRPVDGLACTRSEVSGRRLWGWAEERFGKPERFFATFFVHNFCPIAFLEESGRNRTPDKLPVEERQAIEGPCDEALRRVVATLRPKRVIGVGKYAERQAKRALANFEVEIGTVLHPSPASPIANRGWATQAEAQLLALGIPLP
ncbi:MAG: single-stranded DNA-binding protein [Planctomycetes bacterium]|nr:single-stranded DNA-binding protein [Planctomycetota bacterium]